MGPFAAQNVESIGQSRTTRGLNLTDSRGDERYIGSRGVRHRSFTLVGSILPCEGFFMSAPEPITVIRPGPFPRI